MTIDEVHLLCAAIKNIGKPIKNGHAFVSIYDMPAFERAVTRMLRCSDDYYDSFTKAKDANLFPINDEYRFFLERLAGPYGKVVFAAYCKKHNINQYITWGSKVYA